MQYTYILLQAQHPHKSGAIALSIKYLNYHQTIFYYLKMALTKEQLELAALNAQPGILPKDTKFESYIGHNVINLSNVHLTEHQIRALEKGLTFYPTPNAPDKSQIWENFKEFHRRLELMQFFKPQDNHPDVNISQRIIDFMNENAKTECNESIIESDPYKDIHKNFKKKKKKKI